MAEFVVPEFLQNSSTEELHLEMLEILPTDIDKSEGSVSWDMTRPSALIIARLCEFILPEVIQIAFPQYSYGDYLDDHASSRGLVRRSATAAVGTITVTGTPDVVIPAGSVFSTAAVNDEPSVDYETEEAARIPSSGAVDIPVRCTQAGVIGNTSGNTIILVASRITGITSVTNAEDVSGGTEEESDDSLRTRVAEYDRAQGESFVGSISDYRRWAMSVPGVGEATVVPAEDTGGKVTIILVDSNGQPATSDLRGQVYDYIMRPNDPISRLAPINAKLEVTAPATIELTVTAVIELADGANIEDVKEAYSLALSTYVKKAVEEKEVKYSRVSALLSSLEGVNDYRDVLLNGSTSNIAISNNEIPAFSEENITLTIGSIG